MHIRCLLYPLSSLLWSVKIYCCFFSFTHPRIRSSSRRYKPSRTMNSSKGPSEALTFSSADLRIDHELNFIRRDGGPALFKSGIFPRFRNSPGILCIAWILGDNVTCVLTSYPQRGPVRKDGNPTLSVIYSRSRVPTNRKTRRSDPTIAAGCALRTVQQMLIPRSMVKTRIRCKVINVQHGPNVRTESALCSLLYYWPAFSQYCDSVCPFDAVL